MPEHGLSNQVRDIDFALPVRLGALSVQELNKVSVYAHDPPVTACLVHVDSLELDNAARLYGHGDVPLNVPHNEGLVRVGIHIVVDRDKAPRQCQVMNGIWRLKDRANSSGRGRWSGPWSERRELLVKAQMLPDHKYALARGRSSAVSVVHLCDEARNEALSSPLFSSQRKHTMPVILHIKARHIF